MWLFKLIGLVVLLVGLFVMKNFPDIAQYQQKEMTVSGLFLGMIMFLAGLVLMVFG